MYLCKGKCFAIRGAFNIKDYGLHSVITNVSAIIIPNFETLKDFLDV